MPEPRSLHWLVITATEQLVLCASDAVRQDITNSE